MTISFLRVSYIGKQLLLQIPSIKNNFFCFAKFINSVVCFKFIVKGFSHKTCFPWFNINFAMSKCWGCNVPIYTTSVNVKKYKTIDYNNFVLFHKNWLSYLAFGISEVRICRVIAHAKLEIVEVMKKRVVNELRVWFPCRVASMYSVQCTGCMKSMCKNHRSVILHIWIGGDL